VIREQNLFHTLENTLEVTNFMNLSGTTCWFQQWNHNFTCHSPRIAHWREIGRGRRLMAFIYLKTGAIEFFPSGFMYNAPSLVWEQKAGINMSQYSVLILLCEVSDRNEFVLQCKKDLFSGFILRGAGSAWFSKNL
jgi:hypothetical protein